MKAAQFQLSFKELSDPSNEQIPIEFLPCQFQNNIDECNKDVYFDPIIKPVTVGDQNYKEVSLQGRKMVGKDHLLPEGYKGYVFGKMNQQTGYLNYDGQIEKIDFETLAEFNKVTEWKKDAWTEEKGFASHLIDYLECSKILHSSDSNQSASSSSQLHQLNNNYEDLQSCYGIPDFKECNYKKIELDLSRPKAQLCYFTFLEGHECILRPYCIFAHQISEIQERINEVEIKPVPYNQKRLFHHLGIWPTVCILSFFDQKEIIETFRRINKEALVLCKRAYAPKRVALHRISLETVKFFERTEELKITHDSLPFFNTYKDLFFEEILKHYKNIKTITINFNFLFEVEKKDKFFERLASFRLSERILTFNCEDAMLKEKNLECLTKSIMLQSIQYLKLPRNNLGNNGVQYLFTQERLKHIRKIDISSNHVTEDGVDFIADSFSFPCLQTLDLRVNKIGNKGFKRLITSTNYPNLINLKLDKNKIEEKGAQQLTYICNINTLQTFKLRSNELESKGAQFLASTYAVRNLMVLDISSNAIGDDGFKFIANASYLSNLHKLYVNDNELTQIAAKYLSESKFLGKLRVLSIGKNQLQEKGAQYLSQAANLDQLTHLIINDNDIKEEGVLCITQAPILRNLVYLDINHNDLRENGAYILSVTTVVTNLRYLNLTHNNIGEIGCKRISESEAFSMLQELVIYAGNGINSRAKAHLHRSKKLRSLNHIS